MDLHKLLKQNLPCLCVVFYSEVLFAGNTNRVATTDAANTLWSPVTVEYNCDSTNREPFYDGVPISQWLLRRNVFNTNASTLAKLLTLTQVSKQDDFDVVEFRVPIRYDMLKTNFWSIDLGVINKGGDFALCDLYDSERATNGDCLLSWNTGYDSPGKYKLRARLTCDGPKMQWNDMTIIGPPLEFNSTNDLQFFESSSVFISNSVPLVAKLIEPIANFKIEITTDEGKHLKTITGTTTNGWINLEWNLVEDDGKKFEGNSINTTFEVTYPDKVRSNVSVSPGTR